MINRIKKPGIHRITLAFGMIVTMMIIPVAVIAKDLACSCGWSSGGTNYTSEYAVQGGNCCTGATFGSGYYSQSNSGGSTGSYCSASDAQMACCQ